MSKNNLTEFEIKNIKTPLREKLSGRGTGTLLFKKPFSSIEAYYLYYQNKKETSIKIGIVKIGKNSGLTLSEIREEAVKYSKKRITHPDLKQYLIKQAKLKELEEQKQVELEEMESSKGSFKDLTNSYVQYLKNSNKSSYKDADRYFVKDIFGCFPELAEIKANKIKTDHLVKVLAFHIERGITTGVNRIRSYLLAAFNYGLKIDNDPRHVANNSKRFYITHNPVSAIPKQSDFEKVVDRTLSTDEFKGLWNNFDKTVNINPIIVSALKFLFLLGGQRPRQLLRAPWKEYDYRRKTVNIIDKKGKGDVREYVTPLTENALSILEELPTHEFAYPFTTNGKVQIRDETIQKAITSYCKQFEVEKFTLKDIRRTCKNFMIDAGVNRETRNLIQNHGLTGIDFKHYDKHDHLPEKIDGLKKYTQSIEEILNG